MAVFRVEKNKGYTVMSNHHLRNESLTLKAKGLLSQMLSLPETWDYTLQGLSVINREKIDAIREAVKELERAGYIVRSRERNEKGQLKGADYIIYEQPQPPTPDKPVLENPMLDNPTQEINEWIKELLIGAIEGNFLKSTVTRRQIKKSRRMAVNTLCLYIRFLSRRLFSKPPFSFQ